MVETMKRRHHRHHRHQQAISFDLIKTLFISWSLGAGFSFLHKTNSYISSFTGIHEYYTYCSIFILSSVTYMSCAILCYRYFKQSYNNLTNLLLITLLMICMVISSWFNWLFSLPQNYELLYNIRYGYTFSWINIYRAVEILCLIKIGYDGLKFLYLWYICRDGHYSVNIGNMFNFWPIKKQ